MTRCLSSPATVDPMRRYKKQEAPAWQRRMIAVIAALFAATMLLFVAWAITLYL